MSQAGPAMAYASSDADPFEYTHNGKIQTKPYIIEIDRLLKLGYTYKDNTVKVLMKNVMTKALKTNIQYQQLIQVVNSLRTAIDTNSRTREVLFDTLIKPEVIVLAKIIPHFIAKGVQLTSKMEIIRQAMDENGEVNFEIFNQDQYCKEIYKTM